MNMMPKVDWTYSALGVKTTSIRTLDDGRVMHRVSEVVLPTLRVVPNPFVGQYGRVESIGWTLPIDDTHYRIYTAGRVKEKGVFLPKGFGAATGRRWKDMTPDERRAAHRVIMRRRSGKARSLHTLTKISAPATAVSCCCAVC